MNPKVRAGRRGMNNSVPAIVGQAQTRGRWLVRTAVGAVLALGAGCSGDVEDGSSPAMSGPGGLPSEGAPGGTIDPLGMNPESTSGLQTPPPGGGGAGSVAPPGSTSTLPDGTPSPDSTAMPGPTVNPGPGVEDDIYAIPDAPPPSTLVSTARIARLSRQQWSNTVKTLLQLSDIADIDNDVSGDALARFDSEADALFVTEQLRKELADAAERLADRVTSDPEALARLVPADAPTDLAERARAFVTAFGLKAFRRPLTEEQIADHLSLFDQGPTLYPDLDPFVGGANLVIQAMLQSPHFLYRTELGTDDSGAGVVALDDYEVASKLAFALTNTMPDEQLFAAAAAGELRDRAAIKAQAERLLDGESGVDGLANFNFQVYRLGTYEGIVRDPEIFPTFQAGAPMAMREEMLLFLEDVFRDGGSVKDYYTAPVGFANSAVAPLYGLEGDFTENSFEEVPLDPAQRAGLLTRAGFLSSYISGTDPDIIHRGVFIATRLLCLELPPPDPEAGMLVALQPDMTNRERVEATTGKGTCGETCHSNLFNPLGYAFENYDAIGQYRTMDRGFPVDAADSYTLDGKVEQFSNGVELSRLLAEAKQVHNCYAKNLMSYLHSRVTLDEDAASLDYYARLSRAGMLSVRDLTLDMVTTDTFLTRLP
jgi:hypothetical protein